MEKNSLLRKITIVFLAFAGVFAGATAQRISTTPSGDANLDFKVNEEDVTTAIDSILRGHFLRIGAMLTLMKCSMPQMWQAL